MPLKVSASLSLLLSLSLVTWGQRSDAALTGAVADTTGAVVPNVKVAVANTATGITANAVTNEAGIYLVPSLPPGIYRVTVEHTGFQKMIRNDVLLEVGGKLTLDLTLTVGSASETIEVNANPADTQLGYQTSSVGNVVTGRKLLKRIKIKEGWNLTLRADAINVSNTPVFANPNASINSLNFGNITSTANPARVIVVNARIEF